MRPSDFLASAHSGLPFATPISWRGACSEPVSRAPTERLTRRRCFTGSPWPRTLSPRGGKDLPDYRAVLFDRAAFDCPAGSPSARPYRLRSCCFPASPRLERRVRNYFGADSLRPTRSPAYASTTPSPRRLQGWLPARWLGFDRVGLAPTGRLLRISCVHPMHSLLTSIVWSLRRSSSIFESCRPIPSTFKNRLAQSRKAAK